MRALVMAAAAFTAAACATSPVSDGPQSAAPEPRMVPQAPQATEASSGVTGCRNDGPRLAITGLCEDDALAAIASFSTKSPALPDACTWRVQETEMAAGEVLLYLAASCGANTARLGYAGGAQIAELYLEEAVFAVAARDAVLVRVIWADPDDPMGNLTALTHMVMEDPVGAVGCSARQANVEGWPTDAIVVDVDAATAARAPRDVPRADCGQMGYAEDERAFWRVFGGLSWFFTLGQDGYVDIDPGSLTLLLPQDYAHTRADAAQSPGIN